MKTRGIRIAPGSYLFETGFDFNGSSDLQPDEVMETCHVHIIKFDLDIWNGGSDLDNGDAAGSQGLQVPEGSEVSTGAYVLVNWDDDDGDGATEMQSGSNGFANATWQEFHDASTNYWGEFEDSMTHVERLKVLAAASYLEDAGTTYNMVDILQHGGLSWDGSLDDLVELRCDGLVEVCHEWSGCDAWGEIHSGSTNYSVVTYCGEHEAAITSY